MMRLILAVVLAACSLPALAEHAPANPQDTPYLDDRSTPEAVIRSYYNAINRNEYARAYSYFGSAAAPGYDQWETGYSDTYWVDVSFGQLAQEGAAGSIYYTLPVTLEVQRTEGQHVRYAGCYQLRLAQPTIQAPPFEGIHIESADLHEAGAAGFAPADCD